MRRALGIALWLSAAPAAGLAQGRGLGEIGGRVVDASTGAPLHRARVEVRLEGDTAWGVAPTDSDGSYVLRSLPAGKYRIDVTRRGYGSMSYGAKRSDGLGGLIELSAGQKIAGLNFRLPHLGTITGSVTGADGEPLAGASVQALKLQYPRGKPSWMPWRYSQTDERGKYRLFGVAPGRYLVSANKQFENIPSPNPDDAGTARNRLAYATTYSPGTFLREEAAPIELHPGETRQDVDVAMLVIQPVMLKVQAQLPFQLPQPETDSPPGEAAPPPQNQPPVVNIHLRNAPGSTDSMTDWGAGFPVGGFAQYPNLQPGRYILSGEVSAEGRVYAARQEVDVSGGEQEATLLFAPAIELRGRLSVEGEGAGPAAGRRVFLVSGENRFPMEGASAQVQADGTFRLGDVRPGVWDIGVEPLPKGGYIKSMTLGEEDVLRKDMTITASTSAALEIVVSSAGAELSGQVEGGRATVVVAAPQGDNARVLSFYGVTVVDGKGGFQLKGLTPGVYRVFAFDDMEEGAWMDPEFLPPFADQATEVELKERARETVNVGTIRNPGAGAKR